MNSQQRKAQSPPAWTGLSNPTQVGVRVCVGAVSTTGMEPGEWDRSNERHKVHLRGLGLATPRREGVFWLVQFQLPEYVNLEVVFILQYSMRGIHMRAPFTQLYLHCVWTTWDRLPLITPEYERPIYAMILNKCQEMKCHVLALGGTSDHVHLLVRFPTTISAASLMKEIKGASSHLVTHQVAAGEFFKWQGAYGAFTVSKDRVDEIQTYIERQKEHHANQELIPEWEQASTSA